MYDWIMCPLSDYFSERQYCFFSRSFRLPPDANAHKIEAELKDGLRTIIVPKISPKKTNPAQVEIRKA